MNKPWKFRVVSLLLALCFALLVLAGTAVAETKEEKQAKGEAKLKMKLEKKAAEEEKLQLRREEEERIKREKAELARQKADARVQQALSSAEIAALNIPEDNTPQMDVREVQFSGNTLVSTADIIDKMPLVWSSSGMPVSQSEAQDIYDFRTISEAILTPGGISRISARTIQGFTAYILSLYQDKGYAGIYVYVPKTTMAGANQLKDDILVIEVLEAPITNVTVRSSDADQNVKEKGYLKSEYIEKWSPAKEGSVANQKEVDDFVNLLNQNPDRYVSATVTKGAQPNTLAVEYDVYEINPWHWFIQLDNAGTKDKEWVPRIGVINTNLLGIDDTLAIIFQAPWDSSFDDEYSIYGSYDFPIIGPRVRMMFYAGYSQYDINPRTSDSVGFGNFIGNGHFYGSELTVNVLQTERDSLIGDWFFDVKGMWEHIRSKNSPQIVDPALAALIDPRSDVKFWVWGFGLELHRKDDMSSTTIAWDRWYNGGGASDRGDFIAARPGAEPDFRIDDLSVKHSQYIDTNKVHRVSGSFRGIYSTKRLPPAKMTSFGGMYTVRGYDEFETIADGGILASFQYEYDLIAAQKAKDKAAGVEPLESEEKDPFEIKRAAPLFFFDYGRTTIRNAILVGEKHHTEMISVGVGALLDVGNNFSGAVYWGHPLAETRDTKVSASGKVNVSFMLRW